MTTIEAIRSELKADTTVTGLVAERIYPQLMPQEPTLPAVVLTTVTEDRANSLDGSAETRFRTALLQADCYARTYLQAHQVATAVENVVANLSRPELSAVLDTSRDLYDDETQLHRVSLEFTVLRSS